MTNIIDECLFLHIRLPIKPIKTKCVTEKKIKQSRQSAADAFIVDVVVVVIAVVAIYCCCCCY